MERGPNKEIILHRRTSHNMDLITNLHEPSCSSSVRRKTPVTEAAGISFSSANESSPYNISDSEDDPFEYSGSSYHPSDSERCADDGSRKRKRYSKRVLKVYNNDIDGRDENLEKTTENRQNDKERRARRGEADPNKWKRNKAKALRQMGKEYEGRMRKNVSKSEIVKKNPRIMGERCNSKKCTTSKNKRRCTEITDDQREELFNKFWLEMDWNQRKTFVATLVNKAPTTQKTTKKKSRREFSLFYHLKINDVVIPVCKKMFLSTLCLGEWSVINWAKRSNSCGIISQSSSFPNRKNILNVQKRSAIKSFIERLPKLPSHYCRASSSKMYLENIFNSYSEVYELYKKEIDHKLICSKPVFMSEMRFLNVDIFQPRKDQCDLCFGYKQGNVSIDTYQKHLSEKDRARQEKVSDKDEAVSGEVCTYTMDVQAVQLVPYLPAGMIYFKQKLACHNFTLYSLADNKVVCYVWHEGEGGLDANCFASCLTDFLETEIREEDKNKTKIFYSDGCCAQNRNSLLSNALLHYSISNNVTIIQKYLVKGHSQMECDSVHSTIEAAKKKKEIQAPSNYVQIIEQARKTKEPYKVKYIDYHFFNCYDDIKYYSSIRPGLKKGDPCVTDLRALKYSSQGIEYKLNFDSEWSSLPKRINWSVGSIRKLYDSPLAIKGDKYDHLQSLKSVIHKDYHGFYDNLKKL